ncbi:YARHG domain-containing protein [Ferruginibacter sp.]
MKIKVLFPVLLLCIAASCNSSGGKDKKSDASNIADALLAPTLKILGSFVGDFGDNKITLLITKASGDTIEGRSVVGGNDRPFSGTFKNTGDVYAITASEPGDDKYDGVFNISIDVTKPDVITGSWTPNKPGENLAAKRFTLERKAFRYLQDVGMYPDASKRLLKEADVENLMKPELQQMRNEIFARHGYCFKKKDLREEFENKDWYIPNTVDVKKDLTEIEKKNIALIKKYEKYAEDYGDDFGR